VRQDTRGDVGRWADGVSRIYLHGALSRAIRSADAPLWRHGGSGPRPGSLPPDELEHYRRAAPRMRAFGRRLVAELEAAPHGRLRPELGAVRGAHATRGARPAAKVAARADRAPSPPKTRAWRIPSPRAIKECLDDYVIGQERAKKVLAVAVANHYKRVDWRGGGEPGFRQSNVLLLRPTGAGKTLLLETLARRLPVPCAPAHAPRS